MVLYELIGIVRSGKVQEVKDIARAAGQNILASGGVIRGFTNWGASVLPRPIHKHATVHNVGHHFLMRFDSNGRGQAMMRRTLRLDPRVLRFNVVKLGDKLSEIKDIPGEAEWFEPYGANRDADYENVQKDLRDRIVMEHKGTRIDSSAPKPWSSQG